MKQASCKSFISLSGMILQAIDDDEEWHL